MTNLCVYMPLTWPTISTKVFRSFLDMTGPDVQEELAKKDIKLKFMIHDKFPIDLNRNEAFDLSLTNKYEAKFIMCCDADQVFRKDTILKLLDVLEENPDAGAATGIYFRKKHPYTCVVGKYSPWSKDLENKRAALMEYGFIAGDGQQTLFYKPLQYFDVTQRVHAFGMGCILIRSEIIKQLDRPYFKYINSHSLGGDLTIGGATEDMWFCSQLYQKGIKVLCDPKVHVGHVTEKVIYGNEHED